MKVAVFGASGRTGKYVLEQALVAGHQVVALVRTPSKLAITNPNLKIVEGDVGNAGQVDQVMAGTDAVISVLGPTSNAPELRVTRGMKNILAAMKAHGVRRLIVSVGAGVGDPNDGSDFMSTFFGALVKLVSRNVYNDMVNVAELVRASDRDWTLVRVPMLVDGDKQGSVKVAYVGKGMQRSITRADMAQFIVEQLNDTTYLRQAPTISNPR
jgi:putative NADH-flavin reductase